MIVFPLIMGYMIHIYSGAKPAPKVGNWVDPLIDGLTLLVIGLIYAIPVFIVMVIFVIPVISAGSNGDTMLAIVQFVLMLLTLLLAPAFIIFSVRYVALLYESAPAPA